MGGKRWQREDWLEDYGMVVPADVLERFRGDIAFETFQGSKLLTGLWLAAISAWAGALGALAPSDALWRSWLTVALWPLAAIGSWTVTRRIVLARSGSFVAFVNGHCMFWGILIGVVTAWGAQRDGAGWAYGIAGGLGFLVGVVHGGYEPDDLKNREAVSSIGYLTAPLGACLVAYAWRGWLPPGPGLGMVALCGAAAGTIFLVPWIWAFLAKLENGDGLARLASLLLHSEPTAAEAIPQLTAAMRLTGETPPLLARRGLARALTVDADAAEADWARAGSEADIARGWLARRRGRFEEAAAAFSRAENADKRNPRALLGLASARLVLGDPAEAVAVLGRLRSRDQGPRSYTYLAEAYLALGKPGEACDAATVAIDELDSTHGASWLARAEALRALGRIDEAAEDYNKALWAADEEGIADRAKAGLAAIGRPVSEDEPAW